ncbi:phosphopantetheine binding protein [Sinobacterium caligoides]|uniref:Phosphopantetheine binding protein n=1 Tax=Sinobacterium caligoides TaxID=933926 RepID=A0A3N2DYU8_9GAMM|nr:acyl carrier protein [Sinobacterium caligoides]ROS05040.1 phosphopantetheine binding protein [Sinobacterium caligoides]
MSSAKTIQAEQLKSLLADVLQIDTTGFDADTELLGAIAEFDSMAVISLITALEQQLNINIADDEIDGEAFANFGCLLSFIAERQ